jgi:putative resolvase
VAVTNRDRLVRSGSDIIQLVFKNYGTDIATVSEDEGTTPQDELVKDFITVITSFAGRIYGLRSHKTKRLIQTGKEVAQSSR